MDIFSKLPPAKNQRYLERYIKLMKWSTTQVFENYTEIHHIIPDCFFIENRLFKKNIKKNSNYISDGWLEGNPNDADNLIKLSARVHFISHYLLYKAYMNQKMSFAFVSMSCKRNDINKYYKLTSKQYENFKKTFIPWNKGKSGYKRAQTSQETKQKISNSLRGRKLPNNSIVKRQKTRLENLNNNPDARNNYNKKRQISLIKSGYLKPFITNTGLIFNSLKECNEYYNRASGWSKYQLNKGVFTYLVHEEGGSQ